MTKTDIISIQGICGLPDSIQYAVRVRCERLDAHHLTFVREFNGFVVQGTQTYVGSGEWTVRLM